MSTVIYRLDRGPFSGVVTHNQNGPWRGWYAYSWTAGERSGSCQAVGRAHAMDALHTACRNYFRELQHSAPTQDQASWLEPN